MGDLSGWQAPRRPERAPLEGRFVRLEPLDADTHAFELQDAFAGHDALWDFMHYGPFASGSAYHRWARQREEGEDPRFMVLRDRASGLCGGIAAWLRITPEDGSIEVGHICIAPRMQQTPAVTEAMALMMGWAFAAGYRRYEWKCNALNLASRRAARRLGFSFEGVFRQHMIVKGQNRDTAWFSVIDSEWSALAEAYRVWLDPANFDARGRQRERLSDLTRLVRANDDPGLA
jgi:RimJ/RimL family protein N-acetyltransferase